MLPAPRPPRAHGRAECAAGARGGFRRSGRTALPAPSRPTAPRARRPLRPTGVRGHEPPRPGANLPRACVSASPLIRGARGVGSDRTVAAPRANHPRPTVIRAVGERSRKMSKMLYAPVVLAAALAFALVAAVVRSGPGGAAASSHREAPLISEDPSADNTDLYAFRSQDRPDYLTVISNWIPGEDPAAGPNYYRFSANARYNVYLDRNGDGKPDVTYRFRFAAPTGPFFLGKTDQSYVATKIVGGRPPLFPSAT